MQLLKSECSPGGATFNPGSVCNLACVTCGPGASTRWQRELNIPIMPGNPKEIPQDIIDSARTLTGIVIGGGEPVLNFSTKALLLSLNPSQKISVHFNGTVLPDQDFLEASKQFENISYVFSIDGTEEQFEYLRWPAKWIRVVDNITNLVQSAPDNIEFGVNITVSQLNKQYYHRVVDWVLQTIPQNNQGKKTHIGYNQTNMLTQRYLDELDKKRNLNWRTLFPKAVADMPA